MPRYTNDEKSRAVELYFSISMTIQQIVNKFGYPAHQCLGVWLQKDKRYCAQNFKRSFYPLELKLKAIDMVKSGGEPKSVAAALEIKSPGSIYN